MPTPSNLHVDAFLTNYAVSLGVGSFGAAQLVPPFLVDKESGLYPVFGREQITDDTIGLRAPGAVAPEIDWKIGQGSYIAHEYTWAHVVHDRARDNADMPINLFMAGTRILRNRVLLSWEKRVKTLATTSGNFGTVVAAAGTGWGDIVNGNPELDIDSAREGVETQSGFTANTIMIPPAKARLVKRHPLIRDLIKHTDPKLLVNGDLPPFIFNLRVVIPGAIENTANPAVTATIARVWNTTSAQVCYIDPAASLEAATWALTFRVKTFGANGERVKRYRVEERDGEKLEYGVLQTEVVIAKECGALITGI